MYVFCMYFQIFARICVRIMSIYARISTYYTYLHISMRLILLHAFNTYKYVQYVQILIEIVRAYTYTKYVQIHQLVLARTWWYMHVYDSTRIYLLTAGCWSDGTTMCMVGICMYMNVCVCIWTGQDSMTVTSAA